MGGGMGGMGRRGGDRSAARMAEFSAKDFEKQNPIKLLIDKRKDLNLTTPQLARLGSLDDSLKVKNDTIYARLDSLSKVMRQAASGSADERGSVSAIRRVFGAALAEVQDNFDAAGRTALTIMDDQQRKPAQDLLDKQRKDAEHAMRSPG